MPLPLELSDAVAALLRETAAVAVLPRFRSLAEAEIFEKGPGDLVTVADQQSEAFLTPRLRDLLDIPVVGEEASAGDPQVMETAFGAPDFWTVDPIDGTSNFARGDEHFAVMVGLVRDGVAVAGWILHPLSDQLYHAQLGAGAWCDDQPLRRTPAATPIRAVLEVALGRRDRAGRDALRERYGPFVPAIKSAGWEYPRLATNEVDVVYFRGTYPWDHVPGALLLAEAGGVTRRLDGSRYTPQERGRGMIAAADETTFAAVAQAVGK